MRRRPYVDLNSVPGSSGAAASGRLRYVPHRGMGGGPVPDGRVLTAVVQRRTDAGQTEAVPPSWR